MRSYDVAILGGGPGGYGAALRAAVRGASVCCVEMDLLGGTCLNVGCIPTKAMLHAAGVFRDIADASRFGFTGAGAKVDAPAYMRRVSKVVAGLRKGLTGLLKARKVDVIVGRGRLVGPDTIDVAAGGGHERIKAGAVIIATGSRPARPDWIDWESPLVMTTNEATTVQNLPESALIVGGGVIGCEFATIYAELGIPTTIIELLDGLVADLDADASRVIARSLKKTGVTVLTGSRIVRLDAGDSAVTAELEDGSSVQAERAVVAVGRAANIEDIGLEELGVALSDGVIAVDDHCRTNVENVYAVGDAAETRQYAHLASRMGAVAADNATGNEASDDRTVVPAGVYTHPEVAVVGISRDLARRRGDEIRSAEFPLRALGLANARGQIEGKVKIVAETETGKILGGLVIGPRATDVIQEIALAMRHGLTVEDIARTIHPHPTFAEAVMEAADAWLGLPVHVLR